MGMAAILVDGPQLFLAIFHSPDPFRLLLKLKDIGREVSEEKSFEILNIFSLQMYGPIQMHREGNSTSP